MIVYIPAGTLGTLTVEGSDPLSEPLSPLGMAMIAAAIGLAMAGEPAATGAPAKSASASAFWRSLAGAMLLRLLVINAGKVLTHRMILKQIWGSAYLEQPHILRVNISNLRHKLEKDASRPRYILTESGVGYRFKNVP